MVRGRLFPVLPGADVSEGRFAGEFDRLHQCGDAVRVCDDFARTALKSGAIFLWAEEEDCYHLQ